MNDWLVEFAQHGYGVLLTAIVLQSFGLPVPAGLVLIVAGAAAAQGTLQIAVVLAGSLIAMGIGDSLMYLLGRYTGWWLLGILCRLSLNPERCILRSAEIFQRRGRRILMVAKFVPGLNSMAPPLAGSMQMRFAPFIRADAVGIVLYVGAYFAIGYSCSALLIPLTRGYQAFGHVLLSVAIVAAIIYGIFQIRLHVRERALRPVSYAVPREAADGSLAGALIYDVRSHGYFDAGAVRIKGSKRLDPYALEALPSEGAAAQQVYIYCTCDREATSRRVARELQSKIPGGIRVTVIKGGLSAWRKAGLPVETVPEEDVAAMPVFV